MEKKIKFIENIKTFIDRRRDKKPNKDVEDEAEFEGDASDNNPGKVSMNGGSHGTVFGINKKVIMTVIVSGALILGMATYYSASDKKDKEAVKPQQQTQETAANADGVIRNDKNAVGSYEQLLDQKRRPNGKQGSPPNNSGNAEANGQNGNNPNAAQPVQPVRANMPVPAIPQAPYSAPVTLPSQVNAKSAAQTAEEREAAQAKKSLEDRFKSAIDFALGRNGGNNTSSGDALPVHRQVGRPWP